MSRVSAALLVVGLVSGPLLLSRRGRLPGPLYGSTARVSIVVPARDEATTLALLLDSLGRLDPPAHEVLGVAPRRRARCWWSTTARPPAPRRSLSSTEPRWSRRRRWRPAGSASPPPATSAPWARPGAHPRFP